MFLVVRAEFVSDSQAEMDPDFVSAFVEPKKKKRFFMDVWQIFS